MTVSEQKIQEALIANAVAPEAVSLRAALCDVLGAPTTSAYTREMIPLIVELQVSLGAGRDGIVGPRTKRALLRQGYLEGEDCSSLWPDLLDPSTHHDHYVALCRRVEPKVPGARPLVLGLRGTYPFARRTHRMIHAMRYDDTFVLLRPGATPFVFRGATHAYQLISEEAPNADLKGQKDVGSIRPGTYVLRLRGTNPPIFKVTLEDKSEEIPAFRDTDHDGVISPLEAEASIGATTGEQVRPGVGTFANAILFHPGYDSIDRTKDRPFSSIGCQTAPVAELELLQAAGEEIDFVLANARDLARETPDAGPRPVS